MEGGEGVCFKLEILVFFLEEVFLYVKDLLNTKKCVKYLWIFYNDYYRLEMLVCTMSVLN